MQAKILITTLLGLSVIAVAGGLKTSSSSSQDNHRDSVQQALEDPTTLKARIKPVKMRGERKVTFGGPLIEYFWAKNLADVTSRNAVVIAQPVEKHSFMSDPRRIKTFYKLKINEILSRGDLAERAGNKAAADFDNFIQTDVPAGMSPLQENEAYLGVNGGTVTIDGIETTVLEELGELSTSQRYLFILRFHPSEKVAVVPHGPGAVFKVSSDGRIEAIDKKSYTLRREMESIYGNSVDRLKEGIKRRPN